MLFWLRKQQQQQQLIILCVFFFVQQQKNLLFYVFFLFVDLSPLYAQPASLHFLGKWNFMEKINTHTKTSLHLSVWL